MEACLKDSYFWFWHSINGLLGSWIRRPLPQVTQQALKWAVTVPTVEKGMQRRDGWRWFSWSLIIMLNKKTCTTRVQKLRTVTDTTGQSLPALRLSLPSPALDSRIALPSASCCGVHFLPTWLPLHTQQFEMVPLCLLHQLWSPSWGSTNIAIIAFNTSQLGPGSRVIWTEIPIKWTFYQAPTVILRWWSEKLSCQERPACKHIKDNLNWEPWEGLPQRCDQGSIQVGRAWSLQNHGDHP